MAITTKVNTQAAAAAINHTRLFLLRGGRGELLIAYVFLIAVEGYLLIPDL
jgi:hypothetical protein